MRHAALLLTVAAAAALTASSAGAMIVIKADRGGLITDYAERFLSARATGEQVVIDGACLSACTLVVGMLPRDKVCATPNAVLGFHAAWRPTKNGGKVSSLPASQAMMDVYPADLRSWIARRGGLTTKMIFCRAASSPPSCRPARRRWRAPAPAPPTNRTSSGRTRLTPRSSRGKCDSNAGGGDRRHGEIGGAAERRHQHSGNSHRGGEGAALHR